MTREPSNTQRLQPTTREAWRPMLCAIILAVILCGGVAAAPPEMPPPGFGRYLLVLHDTLVPAANGKAKPGVPDVATMGGQVIGRHDNVIEILLPVGKVNRLRREERVAYVQRLWMGESPERWREEVATDDDPADATGPTLATHSETAATWQTGAYAYDGSGNITAIGADTYQYDTAGRLIRAVIDGVVETYKYDSFGNLKERTRASITRTVAVDAGSNRLSGEAYDAAGNLRTAKGQEKYWYDAFGMVTLYIDASGLPRRMIYGADDERLAVQVDQSTTRWTIRDFDGRVLREFQGQSPDVAGWLWVQDYIHADGKIAAGEREAYYGGKRHYHLDHLGSVRLVTNHQRQRLSEHVFYPFGEEKTNPYQEHATYGYGRPDMMKFTGHQRDFLGVLDRDNTDYLDYMHARYYDPAMARFLSVDPGKDWDMHQPQSWNMYSYVRNNPVNATDPTGKWFDTVVDVVDLGIGIGQMWSNALQGKPVTLGQNLAVAASVVGIILPGATGLGTAVRHADDVADGAKALNGSRKADFVVTESGTAIPVSQSRMKQGFDAAGFPNKPTKAPGTEYTLPDQSKVRTMEPSGNAPRRASFENRNGQPVDPNTGKPPQPPPGLTPAQRKQWVRERTHVEQKP